MNKLAKILTALMLSCMLLVACGPVPLASSESEESSEMIEASVPQGEKKRIGSKDYGFVDIPENWIELTANSQETYLIYASEEKDFVVSLSKVPSETLRSKEWVLELITSQIKSEGGENLEQKELDMNGKNAYCVKAALEIDGSVIVTYAVVDGANMGILSLKAPKGQEEEIMKLLETTYSYNA